MSDRQEPWKVSPACVKQSGAEHWVPGEVQWEPKELKGGLVWSTLKLQEEAGLGEFKTFLDRHYVRGESYSLQYDESVLAGACMPPGSNPEWHVAIRTGKGSLMATITAVPAHVCVGGRVRKRAIINFLCVHEKLRSKRLAAVLIHEVTRRIAQSQVWEAMYTAVAALPRPMASPCYTHLPVNLPYLKSVEFVKYHVPRIKSRLDTPLVPLAPHHLPELFQRYQEYVKKHQPTLSLYFASMDDFKHEIAGPHKYTILTDDMANFASFVVISSKNLKNETDVTAAYLTMCVTTTMPPTTFLRHIAATESSLPTGTHLLNVLTSTTNERVHTPLHSPSPLHFYAYNTPTMSTDFLPFAFT